METGVKDVEALATLINAVDAAHFNLIEGKAMEQIVVAKIRARDLAARIRKDLAAKSQAPKLIKTESLEDEEAPKTEEEPPKDEETEEE